MLPTPRAFLPIAKPQSVAGSLRILHTELALLNRAIRNLELYAMAHKRLRAGRVPVRHGFR
jgi:hypothetical protein